MLKTVISRDGQNTGKVLAETDRNCGIEDCHGTVLQVKWDDGEVSYPCTAGMEYPDNEVGRIR